MGQVFSYNKQKYKMECVNLSGLELYKMYDDIFVLLKIKLLKGKDSRKQLFSLEYRKEPYVI